MRNELEKRIRKQQTELESIDRDIAELETRKRTCKAILNELDSLLRVAPKNGDNAQAIERQLRVDTDPFRAQETLRRFRMPMHIKELLDCMGGDAGRNRRSSLASQLGAYARKGEIFVKTAPNVFGLIDYGPEPITLEEQGQYAVSQAEPEPQGEINWDDDEDLPF